MDEGADEHAGAESADGCCLKVIDADYYRPSKRFVGRGDLGVVLLAYEVDYQPHLQGYKGSVEGVMIPVSRSLQLCLSGGQPEDNRKVLGNSCNDYRWS